MNKSKIEKYSKKKGVEIFTSACERMYVCVYVCARACVCLCGL